MFGNPISRDHGALTLRVRRLATATTLVLGVFFAVTGTIGVTTGSAQGWEILGIVLGAVFLLGWLVFVTTENPVLVVNARGIAAPLMRQKEVLGWGRVAKVRRGDTWAQDALDVYVWKDLDNQTAAGGIEHVLHIPAGLLPISVKKLVPEIESYRPQSTQGPLDRPTPST